MSPPPQPLGALFLRFLRFGCLAWGGPVAQIAMLRQELVDRDAWVTSERFNRVLAVYQALPGPEAHELAVYLGTVARGRVGGLLAGLGFMLPGLCLMLLFSWAYVEAGGRSAWMVALLAGCQPAAVAIVVRAVHRIGAHALTSAPLWLIALAVAAATWSGVVFYVTLPCAALAHLAWHRRATAFPMVVLPAGLHDSITALPSPGLLFVFGLRGGLLTFGGAYSVIAFLQNDAVGPGKWLTHAQFLDGLAIGGILPAPAVIIATFVGFVGAGLGGALAMTLGVFLPAFAFTLLGHHYVERLVDYRPAHILLDGITAGVVGLIAVTAVGLAQSAITSPIAGIVFAAALWFAFRWKSKLAVAVIMLGAGTAGLLLSFLK